MQKLTPILPAAGLLSLLPLLLGSLLLGAASAQASVVFTATARTDSGNPLDGLVQGDLITIDITMRRTRSDDGLAVAGIKAAVFGYGSEFVELIEGSASACLFNNQVLSPAVGCPGGLMNRVGGDLVESLNPGEPYERNSGLVVIADTYPGFATGSGEFDRGVGGNVGGPQARLVFRVLPVIFFSDFVIGTDPSFGGAIVLSDGTTGRGINSVIPFMVLPEPNTALLFGLGLSMLSSLRSRRFED